MKRIYFLAGIVLTIAALVTSIVAYPCLPSKIPTHWNIHGQVDGYGDKSWAAFLAPGIMVVTMVVFWLLPWLSPKHFEVVDTSRLTYLYIMVVLLVFFGYVHGSMLVAALAKPIDVGRAMVGGLFLLIALLGNVLGKVPRNFYIGVRTPWTIASERVWYATHRLAARVFVGAGLLGFLAVIVLGWLVVSFFLLMVALLIPIHFSLVYYKRLEREGEV